MFTALAVGV